MEHRTGCTVGRYATSLSFLPTHHCSGILITGFKTSCLEVSIESFQYCWVRFSYLFFLFTSSSVQKAKAHFEEPDSQHARGHVAACQADTGFGACSGQRDPCAGSGPPFTCGAAGSQSPATGGPGSDCPPLHSSVTAVTYSVESCTKGRETARGPGGPQLPLQLRLRKKPLWDSVFRSRSSLASHMPPASFQVWRNSGEAMPHL